ncbi:hypothetical protein, partial [Brevibacillus sp. MCWH]|uniref:hypothetical protein n=1 Tax=Brevibacillus sp. MCWH TaxID=2508871 RepID=UPI001490E232
MKEGFYDGRTLHFATKYDGSKPFAVETNDCERDEFDAYELAKVLVENGFYIFIAYIENKVINYKVIEIMDTKSDYVIERNYVEVKLINSFTSLEKEEFIKENPKFEKAVLHAIEAINSDFPDQLLPKYCFNPNRLVYVKLFEKDEKGNYYTYNDEGKKLVLNKFSKSLDKINDNPIMRVFHSRKFNDKNVILVDGVPVREVKHYDLHDYIEKSH